LRILLVIILNYLSIQSLLLISVDLVTSFDCSSNYFLLLVRSLKYVARLRKVGPYQIIKTTLKWFLASPINLLFDLYFFLVLGEPLSAAARKVKKAKQRLVWKNMNRLWHYQGRSLSEHCNEELLRREAFEIDLDLQGIPEQVQDIITTRFTIGWRHRKDALDTVFNT